MYLDAMNSPDNPAMDSEEKGVRPSLDAIQHTAHAEESNPYVPTIHRSFSTMYL